MPRPFYFFLREGGWEALDQALAEGREDVVSTSSHAKRRYDNWRAWPLDRKFFSMVETMAHLAYLVCEGKLKQTISGDEYRLEPP